MKKLLAITFTIVCAACDVSVQNNIPVTTVTAGVVFETVPYSAPVGFRPKPLILLSNGNIVYPITGIPSQVLVPGKMLLISYKVHVGSTDTNATDVDVSEYTSIDDITLAQNWPAEDTTSTKALWQGTWDGQYFQHVVTAGDTTVAMDYSDYSTFTNNTYSQMSSSLTVLCSGGFAFDKTTAHHVNFASQQDTDPGCLTGSYFHAAIDNATMLIFSYSKTAGTPTTETYYCRYLKKDPNPPSTQ